MDRKVRVAMLGMGNMGAGHLNELRGMADVEVAALCSLPAQPAEQYNRLNGTDYPVYEDFEQMLSQVPFDALFVCLPPFAHNGQIEKAAAKGIHIFTEKPLALDVQRGESIARAVKAAGVYSQMGYHMRFGAAVKRLRALMEAGETGRATLFSANYECNSLHVDWWRDRGKSGGQILEQIIHLYDLAVYVMGAPDSVSGYMANICHREVPGYTVEDTSAVSIRFKNGTLGAITASNNAIPGRWAGIARIVFENMVVELADHNHGRIIHTRPQVWEEAVGGGERDQSRYLEDRYFIDVIQGRQKPFATIEEGLSDLRLVCGAVKSSSEDGVPVRL